MENPIRPTARDYALSAKLQAMMEENMTNYKAAWKEPFQSLVVGRRVPSKDGDRGEFGGSMEYKLLAEVLKLPILLVNNEFLELSEDPPIVKSKKLTPTNPSGHLEWFTCSRGKSYGISLNDAIHRITRIKDQSPPIIVSHNGHSGTNC